MKILLSICDRYSGDNNATNNIITNMLKNESFKTSVVGIVFGDDDSRFYLSKKVNGIFLYYLPDECQKNSFFDLLFNKNIHFVYKKTLLRLKILNFLSSWEHNRKYRALKKICVKNKIDCVLKIAWKLENTNSYLKIVKNKIAHLSTILIDPISVSPIYNDYEKSFLEESEKKLINASDYYFVPQGWIDAYQRKYPLQHFETFYFPLMEEIRHDEIINSLSFVHFGNISISRSTALISDYFSKRKLTLDIFGNNELDKEACWFVLKKRERSNAILSNYSFMVLVDNEGNYRDYLPSKIVTYIGTLKPIIIFGRGGNYTEEFIQKYPLFFYCKTKNDFNKLDNFVSRNLGKIARKETVLNNYSNNIPTVSSQKVYDLLLEHSSTQKGTINEK